MEAEFVAARPEDLAEPVAALLPLLAPGVRVFLTGDLGTGKTTLVRQIMNRLESDDLVSSPSFSILNVYTTRSYPVAHFDLYRLSDSNDLEVIGAEEYLDGSHLLFVEWPEQGGDFFDPADIVVSIRIDEDGDTRRLTVSGGPP